MLDDEELIYTKIGNNTVSLEQLLDYWHMKYGVPGFQIEYMLNRINLLRGKNNG